MIFNHIYPYPPDDNGGGADTEVAPETTVVQSEDEFITSLADELKEKGDDILKPSESQETKSEGEPEPTDVDKLKTELTERDAKLVELENQIAVVDADVAISNLLAEIVSDPELELAYAEHLINFDNSLPADKQPAPKYAIVAIDAMDKIGLDADERKVLMVTGNRDKLAKVIDKYDQRINNPKATSKAAPPDNLPDDVKQRLTELDQIKAKEQQTKALQDNSLKAVAEVEKSAGRTFTEDEKGKIFGEAARLLRETNPDGKLKRTIDPNNPAPIIELAIANLGLTKTTRTVSKKVVVPVPAGQPSRQYRKSDDELLSEIADQVAKEL